MGRFIGNTKEKINKLKWKYFWEQKTNEVLKVWAWVCLVVSVFYILGFIMHKIVGTISKPYWLNLFLIGFMGSIILGILGLFIGATFKALRRWIEDNLQEAEYRARKEIVK